jgi:hypothetical protein
MFSATQWSGFPEVSFSFRPAMEVRGQIGSSLWDLLLEGGAPRDFVS